MASDPDQESIYFMGSETFLLPATYFNYMCTLKGRTLWGRNRFFLPVTYLVYTLWGRKPSFFLLHTLFLLPLTYLPTNIVYPFSLRAKEKNWFERVLAASNICPFTLRVTYPFTLRVTSIQTQARAHKNTEFIKGIFYSTSNGCNNISVFMNYVCIDV